MKKYEAYKDSGVEWIGKIPEHWQVKRLKYIKSEAKNSFVDGPFGSNLKTDHFIENGDVYVIDSGFITSGFFEFKRGFKTISNEHFETVRRSECTKNDIIISKIGANFGMSGILPELDKPSLVSGNTLKLTVNTREYNLRLIHLQLLNLKQYGEIDLLVKGSAQPALSMGAMSDLPFVISKDLKEQELIINYLDHKTSQLDTLISKKEKLIELLQEERTAIINHAVTKGLNPNAPMRDSGVEWLGEIPEHWEVKRLKYIVNVPLKYGANEPAEEENLDHPRYIRITDFGNDGNLREDTFRSLPPEVAQEYLLKEGDLLFARSGATVGKTFQFRNYKGKACFAGYLIKASFDSRSINSDFINYYTKTNYYENWKQSIFQQATIQNIGADKYNQFMIAFPSSLAEQTDIVNYINKTLHKLDSIVSRTLQEIDLLKEYKTALISEVVTGKVDVRNERLN